MLVLLLNNKSAVSGTPATTLVRSNSNGIATTASCTISLPSVTAGHGLVLTIDVFNYAAVNTVTDNGGGTWVRGATSGSDNEGLTEVWYSASHPASAGTLTINVTIASAQDIALTVAEFSTAISGPRASVLVDSGTTSVASQSATVTSAPGDIVIATQSRFDNALVGNGAIAPAVTVGQYAANIVSNTTAWALATSTSTTMAFNSSGSNQMTTEAISFIPSTVKTLSMEAGTNGTGVTTANSAGSGETAFTNLVLGSGSTATFSTAAKAHGNLGLSLASPNGLISYVVLPAATGAQTSPLAVRFYWSYPSGNPVGALATVKDANGTRATFGVDGSNGPYLQDAAGVNMTRTSATGMTFAANTIYRIEFRIQPGLGGADGASEWAVYAGDSTTPLTQRTFSGGANMQAPSTGLTEVWFGQTTNTGAIWTDYLDDFAIQPGATALIGPYAAPAANQSFTGTPALSATGSLGAVGVATQASSGTAGLSGVGSLASASAPVVTQSGLLSGVGTLGAVGVATQISSGTATLSGTGTVASVGIPALAQSVSLSGAGVLGATGVATQIANGTASLGGSGTLAQVSTAQPAQNVALSGSGTLGASGVGTIPQAFSSTPALSGTGSLAQNYSSPAITETWTGSNGSAWPAQWTQTLFDSAGASATIQSNAGSMSATGGSQGVREYLSSVSSGDVDIYITWSQQTASGQSQTISFNATNVASTDSGVWPQNAYYLQIDAYNQSTGSGHLVLGKYVNNVNTTYSTVLGINWVLGSVYGFRINRTGNVVRYRYWDTAGAEPGTWNVTWTDTGAKPSGSGMSLSMENFNANTAETIAWDNLSIVAPSTPTVTVNTAQALSGAGSLGATFIASPAGIVTLSGAGSLSTVSTSSVSRAVSLSGTGSLSSTVTASPSGIATLSGAGTLTSLNAPVFAVTTALSGIGALTQLSTPQGTAMGMLTGSGALSGTGTPVIAVAIALSASGSLAAATTASQVVTGQTATLSGTGSLAGAGSPTVQSLVALSGAATLSSAGSSAVSVTVALAGSGALSGANTPRVSQVVALSGVGTLAQASVATPTVSVALSGSGSLSSNASALQIATGTAALSGTGTLVSSAVALQNAVGVATLSGSGTTSLIGTPAQQGLVAFSGAGTLTAVSSAVANANVSLSGTGGLLGTPVPGFASIVVLSGTGSMSQPVLIATPKVSVSVSGAGSLSGTGAPKPTQNVALSGSGLLNATGQDTSNHLLVLSGSGSLAVTQGAITLNPAPAIVGNGSLSVSAFVTIGVYTAPVVVAGDGPSTVPGMTARFRAADLTTAVDGDRITTWPDTSGSGNDATAPTSARRPTFKAGIANGRAVLRFDGSTNGMNSPANASSPTQTVIAVVIYRGTYGLIRGSSTTGGFELQAYFDNALISKQDTSDYIEGTHSLAQNVPIAIMGQTDNDPTTHGVKLFYNGIADGSNTSTASFTANRTTTIGYNGASANEWWTGDIAEIMSWDRVLTTAERAAIDSYFQDYYGITVPDYVAGGNNTGSGGSGSTGGFSGPSPILAGNGSLASALESHNMAPNTSGTGSLVSTQIPAPVAAVPLVGNGSLSAVTKTVVAAPVALSGSGGMSVGVAVNVTRTVALSGAGTISSANIPTVNGTAQISGTGLLAGVSAQGSSTSVTFTGAGSIGTITAPSWTATAPLSGTGGLGAVVTGTPAAYVALGGSGALTPTMNPMSIVTSVPITGSGSLFGGTPVLNTSGTAALTGSGSLSGPGKINVPRAVVLSGGGTLAGATIATFVALVNLAGSGSLAQTGAPSPSGQAPFTGSGSLNSSATHFAPSLPMFSGVGTLFEAEAQKWLQFVITGLFSSPIRASTHQNITVASSGNPIAASNRSPLTARLSGSPITSEVSQ